MPLMARTDVMRDAVALACRAPSLHNSQPWRWRFEGRAFDLYSDPTRMLSRTDAFGREMVISCGAVLDHLVVALAAQRWQAKVHRFPDHRSREHLATVELAPVRLVTDAEHERAAAIRRRYTERLPFGALTNWTHYEPVLRSIADDYEVHLAVLPASAHPELVHAAHTHASLRGRDADYLSELRWWTGHFDHTQGVPRTALPAETTRRRVLTGRDFPVGERGWDSGDLSDDLATVLVLSTKSDSPLDCLRCGEALSALLLECTVAGFATCPLTHLTELPPSRAIIADLIGDDRQPQVLVRVGAPPHIAETTSSTPRRPLSEVLEVVG